MKRQPKLNGIICGQVSDFKSSLSFVIESAKVQT